MNAGHSQKARAEDFLALHHTGRPFVLANCWDVVTARLFAREGFPALGTSSYATAATLGLRDGERITLGHTVGIVERLVRSVPLPVSADLEAGYSATPAGVARSAEAVLRAGAVGVNIEDSTGSPRQPLAELALQAERIRAIRRMSDEAGFHPVLNARTDPFLLPGFDPRRRIPEAIRRGRAYVEAGADCVFVPDMGDLDADAIRELVVEIGAPVNVLAGPRTPPMAALARLGVARVSLGPRAMRAALGLFREIAREIRTEGTFGSLTAGALSYEETNALLSDEADFRAGELGGSRRKGGEW